MSQWSQASVSCVFADRHEALQQPLLIDAVRTTPHYACRAAEIIINVNWLLVRAKTRERSEFVCSCGTAVLAAEDGPIEFIDSIEL